jgi:Barrel-sandwich domain of CusB or HlyD membrane-fusion
MSRSVVALLAVLSACRGPADGPGTSPPPVVPGVATVAARTQEVTDSVQAFGTVVGDGERAEVRDARAQLAEAEARAKLAAEQTARLQVLARGGVAPRKELEIAQAEHASATAAAARARAVLGSFGSTTPAPALAGEAAWVMAEVPQDDVGRVRPGATATFEMDAGRTLAGSVEAAAAYVSTSTRTGSVRLRIRDPQKMLRPGMTGAVSIAIGAPRTAVVVPSDAILQDGASSLVVLEEEPGRFQPRAIEPGTTADGWTEVRAGIAPGTRVVTTGATSVLSATRLARTAE